MYAIRSIQGYNVWRLVNHDNRPQLQDMSNMGEEGTSIILQKDHVIWLPKDD
jgi:hypothetical protein